MPDYRDLISLVRGPMPNRPMPAIWDFFPAYAGAIGGVPDYISYYFDVDEKLRCQQRLQRLIPEALILPGLFPDLGVVTEVSAFGGRIDWFDQGAPYIGETIRELAYIDRLQVPEPGLSGLTPLALSQRAVMRRKLADQGLQMERWVMSMGPAEVTGLLMGYEKFYLAMYDDAERLHRLLNLVTSFIIGWLDRQTTEYGGAEALCVADHVCSQVTPEQLQEFILPYMQRIYSRFPAPVRFYHNEGRHSDEHVAMVLDFGAEVWHFGSDVHPLAEVLARVGDRIVLFGGIDPHGVIRHGTPAQVRSVTSAAVTTAADRRMLLSTGTGTTPETSLENQRAMIETVIAS